MKVRKERKKSQIACRCWHVVSHYKMQSTKFANCELGLTMLRPDIVQTGCMQLAAARVGTCSSGWGNDSVPVPRRIAVNTGTSRRRCGLLQDGRVQKYKEEGSEVATPGSSSDTYSLYACQSFPDTWGT